MATVAETNSGRALYWGTGRRKSAVAQVRLVPGLVLPSQPPLQPHPTRSPIDLHTSLLFLSIFRLWYICCWTEIPNLPLLYFTQSWSILLSSLHGNFFYIFCP